MIHVKEVLTIDTWSCLLTSFVENLCHLQNSCSIDFAQYSTGRSQHNTDFAKTNQNEVVRIRMNFFKDFRIRKVIRENEFVILNL